MEVRYETTDKDFLALLDRVLEGSVLGWRFSRFAWLAISALAWLSVLLSYLKFRELGFGFWTRAVFALAITIGFPQFYSAYSKGCFTGIINARTAERLAGPTVLTIEDEFVQVATQTTTARAAWRDVHRLVLTDTHLLLFFTPLVAAPIPRRAFTDDAAFHTLHSRLEALWSSTRPAVQRPGSTA